MKIIKPRIDFYHLIIKDNKLYLDGIEIRGVHGYKLEQAGAGVPMLTLSMYIEPTVIVEK